MKDQRYLQDIRKHTSAVLFTKNLLEKVMVQVKKDQRYLQDNPEHTSAVLFTKNLLE